MSAGTKYEYLWADGNNTQTPLKVSANEYIEQFKEIKILLK